MPQQFSPLQTSGLSECKCQFFRRPPGRPRTPSEQNAAHRAVAKIWNGQLWATRIKQRVFVQGQRCQHRNCYRKATRRIVVNIWGTGAEVDACHEHALQFHGALIESF